MGAHTQKVGYKKRFPPGCHSKANFRDAFDESWHSQLKSVHTTYRNTTPIQILEHLNRRWCPLDVHAKNNLRMAYYLEWDGERHLTAFQKAPR